MHITGLENLLECPRYIDDAYFTIAATPAEDSSSGLFSEDERYPRESEHPCFTHTDQENEIHPIYVRRACPRLHKHFAHHTEESSLDQPPLMTRTWAFQEQVLSTRILHFAYEELIWEYKARPRCECGELDNIVNNSPSKKVWSRNEFSHGTRWMLVVRYVGLNIRYLSDCLPAFSGIGK
ncbi:hypothetical protein B0J14DRAFT_146766 [Halenospora varia]|nr:hypothetical protein B0J14DRAFT_146766 [Halenospora varia]